MVRTQTPSRAMGPQGCSAHPFPGLLCLHCWYLHTHTHRSTLSPRLGELSLTLEKFVYANLASAVFSHQVKWPTTHRHDLQDTHGSPWSAQEGWGHHWHSVTPRSPPGHLSSWTWPRAEAGEAAQEGWSWHISRSGPRPPAHGAGDGAVPVPGATTQNRKVHLRPRHRLALWLEHVLQRAAGLLRLHPSSPTPYGPEAIREAESPTSIPPPGLSLVRAPSPFCTRVLCLKCDLKEKDNCSMTVS